jgi:hypothetical protein
MRFDEAFEAESTPATRRIWLMNVTYLSRCRAGYSDDDALMEKPAALICVLTRSRSPDKPKDTLHFRLG